MDQALIKMRPEKRSNVRNTSHLEQLFKIYYKSLCGVAFNIIKDKVMAEDIVQDMFLKIWKKRYEININTSLKSYLFKSTVNIALNYVKNNKRKIFSYGGDGLGFLCSLDSSEDCLLERDIKEKLTQSIDALPKKCRRIFVLSRFEGMKYKEISEELNISIKTVDNQMGKALKRIRGYMSVYLPKEISKRKLT